MQKTFLPIIIFLSCCFSDLYAQVPGSISGSLEANTGMYNRDSAIGAANTPLYDNLKSGTDAWLSLAYNNLNWGLEAGLRLDVFNNSILFNPTGQYTGSGLGTWFISKQIGELKITGGHFYDQIGTGSIFRAYEERGLGIDNAIFGVRAEYQATDALSLKAFTGQQKNRFSRWEPIIKGFSADYYYQSEKGLGLKPGIGFVNRTLDAQSMTATVNTINALPLADRFTPNFNTYLFSAWNNLNFKKWNWFIEGSVKTKDAIVASNDSLRNEAGSNVFTSLSFSQKGIGITASYKRTENFAFRTSANEILLDGVINFIPTLAKQHSYRLLARYNPSTQDLSEQALNMSVIYSPNKDWTFGLDASNISTLDDSLLYRELYIDAAHKLNKKFKYLVGLQIQHYNQAFYEVKPGNPLVESIVPFTEFTYKFDRKKSLKTEIQYQMTEQDFGDWLWVLMELNLAPHWSFSAGDMYNIDPNPKKNPDDIHYYTFSGTYRNKATKFTLTYARQVEGVICTGGVCRYEPAFSGVKFSVNTSF